MRGIHVHLGMVVALVFAVLASEPAARLDSPRSATARLSSATPQDPAVQRARELVRAMAPGERAGQVIVASYAGHGSPAAMVKELHLGGVVPVADNIGSAEQISSVAWSVRRAVAARGYPAFVGIDQEGGRVTRVGWSPSMMAAGAARRTDLTRALGRATGLQMRRLGFTVVLAPVADITIGATDPTIGTRSAGSRRGLVASQAVAAARGLQDVGVVPVLKHFPGHGSVTTDTHLDLAVQRRTLRQLRRLDLHPFQQAIDRGVPAVMTGHIDVRAVAPGVPATLSRRVTTGLLRRQMGFDGLVVTDSLGMGAITRRARSGDAAVRALRAGADVVLMPPNARAARAGIIRAVREGRLAQSRVDQAATRMIAALLREQSVNWRGVAPRSAQAAKVALTRASLTQVSGACRGRLVTGPVQVRGPKAGLFAAVAAEEGLRVGGRGPVITLFENRVPAPSQVAVALDRPHLLGKVEAPIRFATYGHSREALRSVVLRLLGRASAPGHLPTPAGRVPRVGC